MALPALLRTICPVAPSSQRCLLCLKASSFTLLKPEKYICYPHVRNIYKKFFKVTPKTSAKLKLSDGVPSDYTLIYQTPIENYMKIIYPIVAFCSVTIPTIFGLFLYVKGRPELDTVHTVRDYKILFINSKVEVLIYFGAMCLFALSLFAVMFKTPLRIYKHSLEQKYIAIFIHPIPTKFKQFHFSTASETKFKNPLYSFLSDCQFLIDKKKVLLFSYYFRTPADFFDMLGLE